MLFPHIFIYSNVYALSLVNRSGTYSHASDLPVPDLDIVIQPGANLFCLVLCGDVSNCVVHVVVAPVTHYPRSKATYKKLQPKTERNDPLRNSARFCRVI